MVLELVRALRNFWEGLGLGLGTTLRVLTNWGTSKCRVSETPKRPKGSP